jgi:hypothetical protein
MIVTNPPPVAPATVARGSILREFVPRGDRVPRDQRVDAPEIQESFRVNFSNAALAAASGSVREATQRPTATDDGGSDLRLRTYRDMAAL